MSCRLYRGARLGRALGVVAVVLGTAGVAYSATGSLGSLMDLNLTIAAQSGELAGVEGARKAREKEWPQLERLYLRAPRSSCASVVEAWKLRIGLLEEKRLAAARTVPVLEAAREALETRRLEIQERWAGSDVPSELRAYIAGIRAEYVAPMNELLSRYRAQGDVEDLYAESVRSFVDECRQEARGESPVTGQPPAASRVDFSFDQRLTGMLNALAILQGKGDE